MENKEIIIDDVDVSGCDFLAKEDDYCCYSGEYRAYKGQCGCSDEEMCKNHPNCFYKKALKQLARKEQECEQKDKDIKYLIKCLDNSFKTRQDSEFYWEREKEKLKAENIKLKQTLTKIKEIVEDAKTKVFVDMEEFWKQILKIIDEVE